jgi:nitrogen regulatory protein PII
MQENVKIKAMLIVVIVERGKGSEAVEIAKQYGAEGGTIFLGEGTTGADIKELIGIKFDSEKEIAMIMINENYVDAALEGLTDKLQLCKPGRGIAFVLDIFRTQGICHVMKGGA